MCHLLSGYLEELRKYFLLTERLGFSHWKKDDAELAYEVYGNFSLRLPVSPAFKKAELNHDGDDAHAAIKHVEG